MRPRSKRAARREGFTHAADTRAYARVVYRNKNGNKILDIDLSRATHEEELQLAVATNPRSRKLNLAPAQFDTETFKF